MLQCGLAVILVPQLSYFISLVLSLRLHFHVFTDALQSLIHSFIHLFIDQSIQSFNHQSIPDAKVPGVKSAVKHAKERTQEGTSLVFGSEKLLQCSSHEISLLSIRIHFGQNKRKITGVTDNEANETI